MSAFHETLMNLPQVPTVIISVALMLFSGFLLTRVTKRLRLPNVTAYIVAGILIGPYGLNLVPQRIIDGTDFLSDIALAFIAFTSTAKGGTISKIKSILTPGAVVTTSKNDVDYIVTEYGVAHLRGRSLGERARQLIAIAHPDFRDELTFEAKKRGIMI